MTAFAHVTDQITRELLEGKRNSDTLEADIQHALEVAYRVWDQDLTNEAIPVAAFATRNIALNAANEMWQVPSVAGALANLKIFWSI